MNEKWIDKIPQSHAMDFFNFIISYNDSQCPCNETKTKLLKILNTCAYKKSIENLGEMKWTEKHHLLSNYN